MKGDRAVTQGEVTGTMGFVWNVAVQNQWRFCTHVPYEEDEWSTPSC